jgi:hypothetical protein
MILDRALDIKPDDTSGLGNRPEPVDKFLVIL